MKEIGQESEMQAAMALVSDHEPPRSRDQRNWLIELPAALVVIYASLCAYTGLSRYLALLDSGAGAHTQGKYEAAEAIYTEAVRLRPGFPEGHNRLGTVLYTLGKNEEAVAQFSEALRLNSGYADAHGNLGVALQRKGNYQAAEGHYAEAIRLRPGDADARKNLGNALNAQGKLEAATTQFTEALRLNPGDADAHNSLGTTLSRQKKFAEARAQFSESIRLEPENVHAHYNLGFAFSHVGNYEEAKAEFAEAIRLQSGDPRSYNASAMIMATCPEAQFRDGKKAVQFATRACELTQWKNPIILDTLAAAQAEAGDFGTAVKSETKAIELLTDERQKENYRTRLVLYQAKRPFHEPFPQHAATGIRP